MCDIFTRSDAVNLLRNKHVIFIGDSNTRALYKDLLWLLNRNTLIDKNVLKKKLEQSFLGDSLRKGDRLVRGRDYVEVREYKAKNTHVEFFFITRCFTEEIESLMIKVRKNKKTAPNLIIFNSCLWDITRWGPNGVPEYKDNLVKLMKLMKRSLPSDTLVVWITVPPISQECRGGLLVNQVKFFQHTLRFEVMEANMFARQLVVAYGFDVLDIHYYLRMQIHMRATDGIHWFPAPVRHMTNLLLTHVALSWNQPLPCNFHGASLERMKNLDVAEEGSDVKLPKLPIAVKKFSTPCKSASAFKSPFMSRLSLSSVCPASPLRKAIKEKLSRRKLLLTAAEETEDVSHIAGNNQCKLKTNSTVNGLLETPFTTTEAPASRMVSTKSVPARRNLTESSANSLATNKSGPSEAEEALSSTKSGKTLLKNAPWQNKYCERTVTLSQFKFQPSVTSGSFYTDLWSSAPLYSNTYQQPVYQQLKYQTQPFITKGTGYSLPENTLFNMHGPVRQRDNRRSRRRTPYKY